MKARKNPLLTIVGCLLLIGGVFLWRGGQHVPALIGGGLGLVLVMLFGSGDFWA